MEVKRILLVDDEEDIRKIAALSLEKIGKFELFTAASGEEGIAMAQEIKPDIIIMDLMMPGMDGLCAIEKLRMLPDAAGIPVVFMTAKTQSHEKKKYIECGARGVIEKPFDPMTLSDEIRRIASDL